MSEPGRRNRAVALSLFVAILALIVANFVFGQTDAVNGEEDVAGPVADSTTTTPPTTQPLPPCSQVGRVELNLTVSTEKSELLDQLADRYNQVGRVDDNRCVEVIVSKVTSGQAQESLLQGWEANIPETERVPKPDAWAPTSSIWATLLEYEWAQAGETPPDENGGQVLDQLGSMAESPLTIAMREPMAEALGWPETPIGWRDVLELINNPDGWASVNHPEWGRFTLGKDNPRRSTSGMAATIAAFYAGSGSPDEITLEQVQDPQTREFVSGVERGVERYSDEATKFLARMAAAEAELSPNDVPFISAALIQEQLVYLYNTGNPTGQAALVVDGGGDRPRVPLVAISPVDGTLMMDHPFVVLPWASPAQRQVAEGFYRFILQPEQQSEFPRWGFREANGVAGELLVAENVVRYTARPPVVDNPAAEVVKAVLDSWDVLRKRVRLLILYDVSGSMTAAVRDDRTGLQTNRHELAKPAVSEGIDFLSPDDEVGIWLFSDESRFGSLPYVEWIPPSRIGPGEENIKRAIQEIGIGGDTALYRTILTATRTVRDDYDSELINAILVLSDGENDDGGSQTNEEKLEALLNDLEAEAGAEPIRVFAIAYGKDSDLAILREIAELTGGAAYNAQDANTIRDVFVDVVSNF